MFGVVPTDEGLVAFIEKCNAAAAFRYSLNISQSNGPSPVVLQPHPDDVALSIGGLLALIHANVTLLTVFGSSQLSGAKGQRAAEDAEFAGLLGADLRYLNFSERSSSSQMPEAGLIEPVVRANLWSEIESGLLIAPAAVSRHPDHRVVQQIAANLGSGVFWEDVAFWGIYGSSVDDRVLFSLRNNPALADFTLVAVDISCHLESKAMMLGCYRSQSLDVWRPLRYAWTAAREIDAPFQYCERLFVRDDCVVNLEHLVGASLVRAGTLLYGATKVRTGWMGT